MYSIISIFYLNYSLNFSPVELFKKLKNQGSKKHSTSNAKSELPNTKKRKDTPPGIIFMQICFVHLIVFVSFLGSPRSEKHNQPTYTKTQLDTVKRWVMHLHDYI